MNWKIMKKDPSVFYEWITKNIYFISGMKQKLLYGIIYRSDIFWNYIKYAYRNLRNFKYVNKKHLESCYSIGSYTENTLRISNIYNFRFYLVTTSKMAFEIAFSRAEYACLKRNLLH